MQPLQYRVGLGEKPIAKRAGSHVMRKKKEFVLIYTVLFSRDTHLSFSGLQERQQRSAVVAAEPPPQKKTRTRNLEIRPKYHETNIIIVRSKTPSLLGDASLTACKKCLENVCPGAQKSCVPSPWPWPPENRKIFGHFQMFVFLFVFGRENAVRKLLEMFKRCLNIQQNIKTSSFQKSQFPKVSVFDAGAYFGPPIFQHRTRTP